EMPEDNGVYFGHSNMVKNYSAVTAACMLMRRDVFEEIGGFNPELAVSFNDIDLCLEIRRRGYRIVYTPYTRLIHHESVSRLDDNEPVRRPRFHGEITYMISKWGQTLYEDPYLNPNISILKYDMSPRDPGENATLEAFRRAFSGFIWNV
ncbi:MAG TPA: glycosyltransferase, partial [bacterium]|nr:glycosyltransferase [bacterium]